MQQSDKMVRKRGRPREFDREKAMGTAIDAFWKHGYRAVSVSDLADAMSITRTSFYNAFQDRSSLFLEALDSYRRAAPDRAFAEVRAGEPVVPAVRRIFREICKARASDREARGCLIVNSITEIHELEGGAEHYLRKAVNEARQVFRKLIEQAVAQGEIKEPGDPKALSSAFVTFVLGLNTISKVVRSERELWRICDLFLSRHGFVLH